MKLSECCRKLETEEQKILPFREAPLTEHERRLLEAAAREPAQEPLAEVRAVPLASRDTCLLGF